MNGVLFITKVLIVIILCVCSQKSFAESKKQKENINFNELIESQGTDKKRTLQKVPSGESSTPVVVEQEEVEVDTPIEPLNPKTKRYKPNEEIVVKKKATQKKGKKKKKELAPQNEDDENVDDIYQKKDPTL